MVIYLKDGGITLSEKKTDLTRRKFMTMSSVAIAAPVATPILKNMGGLIPEAKAAEKQYDFAGMKECDLVVLGGGGAGLMSAISAAEGGVKNIILLEKADHAGGNTSQTGVFFAVNSPLQKRLGINVTEEQVFREKMSHDHWRPNSRLIRNTIKKSGSVAEFLENIGIDFEDVGSFAGDDAPRVGHMFKGPSGKFGRLLIGKLTSICEKKGVKILYETSANKILTDNKGNIEGVSAITKQKAYKINAKGVIIATGGFARNKDLVKKYFPYCENYKTSSKEQMTGDGLIMAEEIGAIVDDQLSILLVGPHPSESSPNVGLHQKKEMVAVNKEGERFYDESLRLHYNIDDETNTLTRQRDKEFYALLDSVMLEDAKKEIIESENYNESMTRKNEITADTWDEIANFIDVSPDVLKATIQKYNSFCDKRYDSDFFKDKKYLKKLSSPPFFAVKVRHSTNTTFGGIKINHRTEVLNKYDLAIKGLYAAGDCAGSWAPLTYSHNHPGSASSFAICSGNIAGENAAKYILNEKYNF